MIIHGRSEESKEWILAQPDVMVASDGIPFVGGLSHPRSAGTFSRVLGHYVRERGTRTLMQAMAKMTILPARRLEAVAPAMKRKGRIEVGADADLTVFDAATILDRATYESPAQTSAGVAPSSSAACSWCATARRSKACSRAAGAGRRARAAAH